MSHLHVPDGVLPVWLWAAGLLFASLLLVASIRRLRGVSPQRVAYQATLGALVLVGMAVQIPLGPFEYHLALVGPVGVLLGAAAGYQVVFVASAMLAFVGHGGFTVIGLNALVLGAGVALARPVYESLRRKRPPAISMSGATAVGQAVSGALWLVVVTIGLRAPGGSGTAEGGAGRVALLTGIVFPVWFVGVAVETMVAYGIARFLGRVRPDLLPQGEGGRPQTPRAA